MAHTIQDKGDSSSVEQCETKHPTPDSPITEAIQHGDDLNAEVVKKLIRRVDLRIMPALGMLYAVSLIDRVNLSAVSLLPRPN